MPEEEKESCMVRLGHGLVGGLRLLAGLGIMLAVVWKLMATDWWVLEGSQQEKMLLVAALALLCQLGGKIFIRGYYAGMLREMGWKQRLRRLPVAVLLFVLSAVVCTLYFWQLLLGGEALWQGSAMELAAEVVRADTMFTMHALKNAWTLIKLLFELLVPPLTLCGVFTILGYTSVLDYCKKAVRFVARYVPAYLLYLVVTGLVSVVAGVVVSRLVGSTGIGGLFDTFEYTQSDIHGLTGVVGAVASILTGVAVYYSLSGVALDHYGEEQVPSFVDRVMEQLKAIGNILTMAMCAMSVVLGLVASRSSGGFLQGIIFLVFAAAWVFTQYLFLQGTNVQGYVLILSLMHLVTVLIPVSALSFLPGILASLLVWIVRIFLFAMAAAVVPANNAAHLDYAARHPKDLLVRFSDGFSGYNDSLLDLVTTVFRGEKKK